MMENAVCTKNDVLAEDLEKACLTQHDGERSLHQRCRCSSRFRMAVMTKFVLTENDAKQS